MLNKVLEGFGYSAQFMTEYSQDDESRRMHIFPILR